MSAIATLSFESLVSVFQQADAFPGHWDLGYTINADHLPVFDGTIRCQDAQMHQSVVSMHIPLEQEAEAERLCEVVNFIHKLGA